MHGRVMTGKRQRADAVRRIARSGVIFTSRQVRSGPEPVLAVRNNLYFGVEK